jgi:hypothetical protein
LIGGGIKGRIFHYSHWSKKKCQSWYIREKWCNPLKMEKRTSFGDEK